MTDDTTPSDQDKPLARATESMWTRYARAAVTAMPPNEVPAGMPQELREIATRLASHADTLAALYKEADARPIWDAASRLKTLAARLGFDPIANRPSE